MRVLAMLGLMLLAAPAWGQGALRYENTRFGFALEVPAGFVAGEGDEAGQSFELAGEEVTFRAWGEPMRGPLAGTVARIGRELERSGWRAGEQMVTPDWASFSAVKGSRMRFGRTILLCDRRSTASWQIEISAAQFGEMRPVLDRLGRSLRKVGC
ncbi:hypothetical protein [Devosia sp. 1635]|uniref:hypothetical protein n=1 Tax=Devosia sp. 1635 TaxID=2726066 RepID=UPI001567169E|nr:hypothetical protein [Devosia sp. 1635]